MIIHKSPRRDREDAPGRARSWPTRSIAMLDAVAPGVTTADLDRDRRAIDPRRRAPRRRSCGYRGSYPATICASINDEIVHGIPSAERVLDDGRRRSRSTAGPSGTGSTATPPSPCSWATSRRRRAPTQLVEATGGRAGGRDRRDPCPAGASPTSATPSSRWRSAPGSRSCASTAGTGSAGRCTRTRSSRTAARRAGAGAEAGPGDRRRAHGDRSGTTRPGSWRRMDGGHGRRLAGGPFRAHDRRHRGRPRGPHGAELVTRHGPPPAVRGRTW